MYRIEWKDGTMEYCCNSCFEQRKAEIKYKGGTVTASAKYHSNSCDFCGIKPTIYTKY